MTSPIYNDLSSPDLAVTVLQDPVRIRLFRESVAGQINRQRMAAAPSMECLNLSERIADVIIETSAQGAGLLEVHIIDPAWGLLRRYSTPDGSVSFFDVDETGYLWPPIDLNFPPDVSDAQWRLCQLRPSTDLTAPNLICVFEDKVASVLREFSGPVLSRPNETRAEFIQRLVKEATVGGAIDTGLPPGVATAQGFTSGTIPTIGMPDGSIRFIPLLPNLAFTAADLTADQFTLPASAKQPNPPPARQNPNKTAGGSAKQGILPELPRGGSITIPDQLNSDPNVNPGTPLYVPPNTSAGNPEGIVAP